VSAFVEADRCEVGCRPGGFGVEVIVLGLNGPVSRWLGKTKPWPPCALAEAVVEQFAVEGGRDRDAAAGAALGRDEAAVAVPALLDVDQVSFEVDLVPGECLKFAEA
jgi:hypothetical protein